MKKKILSVLLIILVCLLLVLQSGCSFSEFLAFIALISKAEGQGSISMWVGVKKTPIEEETGNSVTFHCTFMNEHKSELFDLYDLFVILSNIPGFVFFFELFFDPLILQYPSDVTNISGTYNDYQGIQGNLTVVSDLDAIPVTPEINLMPEPGHKLAIIDFPDDPSIVIPEANEPEKWYQFTLSFRCNPARDIEIKCICAGKVVADEEAYYVPLCPATTDFTEIPPITIPMAETAQEVLLPHSSELPHPGDTLTYDFSSLGEQTLYFPRLSFVPGVSTEGFGFVNSGQNDASVTFTGFNSSGTIVGTSDPLDWLAGTQGAFQADILLGLSQDTNCWVTAESDQTGLKGFFLSQLYDAQTMAGMDGASVFTATITDGIIPRIQGTNGYATEIFIANPGDSNVDVTVTGYDGTEMIAGGVHLIGAKGVLVTDLETLFGAKAVFDGFLHLEATGGVIANATIRFGDNALSSSNVLPVSEAAEILYASHIVLFPGQYSTSINLINTSDTDAVVTISPFLANGDQMTAPFTRDIPANQILTLEDEQLGLPPGENTDGWLKMESQSHPLLGSITFGHPVDKRYESTLPLQSAGAADIHFAQVANGQVGAVNYSTGLAVINPSADTPVDVAISVHKSDGSVNGNVVNRTLQPGEKYVRELRVMEGIGTLEDQASGYVHITANGPVLSFELFYDNLANFMSAVMAQF